MNYGPRGHDLGNSLGSGSSERASLERAAMNRARRARASVRQPSMKRGAAFSAGAHVAALLALLIVIPHSVPPPPPDEDTVAVEFEGHSAHAQKAEKTGTVAAPTDNDAEVTDNPAIKNPDKAPIVTAPPPPPPPPPPPMPEEVIKPPDVKIVEPPKPAEKPAPVKPPPPKQQVKPPPTPVPPPKLKSVRSQPNQTKNAVPDTRALDNTLEKFLADQTQKPPTSRYNPERGGKKNGGGSKSGFLTGELSDGQRKQIGDEVHRCYSEDDPGVSDYRSYSVIMTVTIDATGEARDVKLSDADQSRANSDPLYRAFAERAVRAVLDPVCAKLPVPPDLLGKPAQDLMFRFRP